MVGERDGEGDNWIIGARVMEATINTMLLRVVLGEVLHRLAVRDLKSAVLVGRRWRKEGEDPG